MKQKKNILASTLTTVGLVAITVPASAQFIPATDVQNSTAVQPFQFHASDEALADLRKRVQATKWPERENVNDASQGVQLATMRFAIKPVVVVVNRCNGIKPRRFSHAVKLATRSKSPDPIGNYTAIQAVVMRKIKGFQTIL
jgi:hypothetical protein